MKVIKRDGRIVDFDKKKIYNAILKANKELDTKHQLSEKEIVEVIAVIKNKIIKNEAKGDGHITVEEIQDIVENTLMDNNFNAIAKEYIIYRKDRERIRVAKTGLMKEIAEKIQAVNVQNQNANVDEHSFGGRMGEANSAVMKNYALNYCMSEMAKNNHLNNEIYIHDLDSYAVGMHNCLSIPFDKLLKEGFNTRQTDVRPANSINTAFQLIAVIFQLQSLQEFGGVSATHLDWTMVPYVRKSFSKHFKDGIKYLLRDEEYAQNVPNELSFNDKEANDKHNEEVYRYAIDMVEREIKQAVEGMYHNLNTLQSRSGNQLPFTSINYGTCTLPEGRMVTKALLEVSIEGIGKMHRTSIFPCGIFQCMKGVNRKKGDPNYDLFQLALRSTAQRLYPNYVNVDWSVNEGYDRNDPTTYVSTMGCRTYNGADINALPGVNPQRKDGRGNICPVTIIMPTLAMEAITRVKNKESQNNDCIAKDEYVAEFMKILDTKIHEAKDMLLERFEWICSQSPKSAQFMYENKLMEGYVPEEGIRSALKHGTLALGQLGLAETLQLLIGENQTTSDGMSLAKRIESLFKQRCAEFKKEYSLNFGVYYTPAENLCHTAMTKFKNKYGEIPNVSDRTFFTNSIHVPVWEEVSVMDKINIESQLTGYSSAGCITYVELESGIKNNLEALEEIVNYAMDKDIPYFAINVPNDTCLDCGYCDEFNDECPVCHSKHIQQLRRVTGYLTGNYTTAFNKGKQDEVKSRFKHSKKGI